MSGILVANIMQTIEKLCFMCYYKGKKSSLRGTVSQKPLISFQKPNFKLQNLVNMKQGRFQKSFFKADWARIQIRCRHYARTQSSEKMQRKKFLQVIFLSRSLYKKSPITKSFFFFSPDHLCKYLWKLVCKQMLC